MSIATDKKAGAKLDAASLRVPYKVRATDWLAEGKRKEAEEARCLGS